MKKRKTDGRRYFKELRFQQLRALLEVSRLKSFAAAAAALKLATPSVWNQVRALEATFGVALVQVESKAVELTADGRKLVAAARPVVDGYDALQDIFADPNGTLPKQLALASTNQLLMYELRRPLAEYRRRHPDVQLTIIDRSSTEGRACVEHGAADVAIVGQFDEDLQTPLAATRLMAYPFVLMTPAGHPLLTAKRLSLKAIARHPLVLPSREAHSRTRVDERFLAAGLLKRLNVAVDASKFELLAECVAGDFGVSVVSVSPSILRRADQGDRSLKGLGFRDLTRQFGEETIVLLRRPGDFQPPHHQAFSELIEQRVR